MDDILNELITLAKAKYEDYDLKCGDDEDDDSAMDIDIDVYNKLQDGNKFVYAINESQVNLFVTPTLINFKKYNKVFINYYGKDCTKKSSLEWCKDYLCDFIYDRFVNNVTTDYYLITKGKEIKKITERKAMHIMRFNAGVYGYSD